MKILFIGTSNFSIPILKALNKGEYKPVQTITQPINLEPKEISKTKPDLIVVATYGKVISKDILNIPKLGVINIHPSLLPKYRGPSPIQTTILNNDGKTGTSLILMDQKIDHGPIIAQKEIKISPKDNYQTLEEKLAKLSAELLIKTLPKYLVGGIKPEIQQESQATYTKLLTRRDGQIDWHKEIQEIERMTRAFYPWPGTWTYLNDKRIKIIQVKINQNCLELQLVQPEGKRIMTGQEFLRGYRGELPKKICPSP